MILLGERACRWLSGLPVLCKEFLKEQIAVSALVHLFFCTKPPPLSSCPRDLVSETFCPQLSCFLGSIVVTCFWMILCLFACELFGFFFQSSCTGSRLTPQLVGVEFWLAMCGWVRIWPLCNMRGMFSASNLVVPCSEALFMAQDLALLCRVQIHTCKTRECVRSAVPCFELCFILIMHKQCDWYLEASSCSWNFVWTYLELDLASQ